MISNWTSSLSRSIQESRFLAARGSPKLFRKLPNSLLARICKYLSPKELERFTYAYTHIRHLAFNSPSGGGEALWTDLYRRDYPSSMALAEQVLGRQTTRLRDLSLKLPTDPPFSRTLRSRGFFALIRQALAALERSSIWPATRADVRAHLYPARLSVHAYNSQQVIQLHTPTFTEIQLADGRIASGLYGGVIRIWPLDGGDPESLWGHNGGISRIIQLADGRIASASDDRTIRVWPLGRGAPLVLVGHTHSVLEIIQLADGRIASASDDRTIRVWPLGGGEPLVFAGHTHSVRSIIQLADGRIASASNDHTIRIWPLDGVTPRVFAGHTGSVRSIIQLANGRIASASNDHTIRVWPLSGGAPRVFAGHTGFVRSIIQLANGCIASASNDHTIRVWPLSGGAPRVLAGHNEAVLQLLELADGRIASASYDRTIRVWPLSGGAPRVLAGHNQAVGHIIQLADGRIASTSDDHTIRIWGYNTDELVLAAARQARYRKAVHRVSRKAIMALGFVMLAWVVNGLLTTIARRFTHTT